jgi:hypothetical protein
MSIRRQDMKCPSPYMVCIKERMDRKVFICAIKCDWAYVLNKTKGKFPIIATSLEVCSPVYLDCAFVLGDKYITYKDVGEGESQWYGDTILTSDVDVYGNRVHASYIDVYAVQLNSIEWAAAAPVCGCIACLNIHSAIGSIAVMRNNRISAMLSYDMLTYKIYTKGADGIVKAFNKYLEDIPVDAMLGTKEHASWNKMTRIINARQMERCTDWHAFRDMVLQTT